MFFWIFWRLLISKLHIECNFVKFCQNNSTLSFQALTSRHDLNQLSVWDLGLCRDDMACCKQDKIFYPKQCTDKCGFLRMLELLDSIRLYRCNTHKHLLNLSLPLCKNHTHLLSNLFWILYLLFEPIYFEFILKYHLGFKIRQSIIKLRNQIEPVGIIISQCFHNF